MIIVHFESCITNKELSWLVGSSVCSLCPDFLQFPLNESCVLTDTLSSFSLQPSTKPKDHWKAAGKHSRGCLYSFFKGGPACLNNYFIYLYSLPLLKSKSKKVE